MTHAELVEWVGFNALSPIGDDRADLIGAMVAATVMNSQGGDRGRPVQPSDYMPRWDAGDEDDEQLAIAHERAQMQAMIAFTAAREIEQNVPPEKRTAHLARVN